MWEWVKVQLECVLEDAVREASAIDQVIDQSILDSFSAMHDNGT